MAIRIDERDAAIARMAGDWSVIEALLGGTPAMRKAGKMFLPQQPREDDEDYAYRLETATLFPAFERTVTVMAGKPFSKQATVGDDVPAPIRALLPDVDARGSSLHVFSSKLFRELVAYGLCGILVDFTKTSNPGRSLADDRAQGARPYWVGYRHDQILGCRFESGPNGERLAMVRLLEWVQEADGEYGSTSVPQVRVLRVGSWETWRRGGSGWALHESGASKLNYIPFALLVANPKDLTEGSSALRNLAYLNVKHWQQQSDQDDSTRFARKRLLVFSGVDDGEISTPTAGAAYALRLERADSRVEVVQGSAESVSVGRSELQALEEQMIQTGAELLVAQPGQRTATEATNDAEANKSSLQSLSEDFEDALDFALQCTADWMGLGDGGTVSLFSDYGAATLSDASAQLIFQIAASGWITKATGIKEMQRRAVLSPDIDAAMEIAQAEAEGPTLGGMRDGA